MTMMKEDGESLAYTPQSILDTDLYKLMMQQAVRRHFPETRALYRFTHRDHNIFFPRNCVYVFQKSIERFRDLSLTLDERDWLEKTCPYFTKEYLDYLAAFQFNPDQVSFKFVPISEDGECGNVEIEAKGLWVETILWEVPMMACLSELYFRIGATDWSYEGQKENASQKARTMLRAGCTFSEFGTRRRRSFYIQDLVVATMKEESEKLRGQGNFVGTSNVYFSKKYNIDPVGTIAHEWFMGIAALKGYEGANAKALELWQKTYPDSFLVALTDTFSTKVFFQDLAKDPDRARKWAGLRQDSGDPLEFAPAAKAMYDSIGVDIRTKNIIYSDALTLEKALKLKKQCDEIGFKCSFGIGTFLTNDFKTKSSRYTEKSRALNMVIKLAQVDEKECVKISDDPTKNTGDKAMIECVKRLYGLSS
ncbi:nicotinate phosphoribosyltransferase [Gyrodon lividus]|nr:nicotinate phosphoribosyltransferase [Gyrodon lividus]